MYVNLPEVLTSLHVPLSNTLPSGQIHLAPVGLSRHMNSQDILRHGFDTVEAERERIIWLAFDRKYLFVNRKCIWCSQERHKAYKYKLISSDGMC